MWYQGARWPPGIQFAIGRNPNAAMNSGMNSGASERFSLAGGGEFDVTTRRQIAAGVSNGRRAQRATAFPVRSERCTSPVATRCNVWNDWDDEPGDGVGDTRRMLAAIRSAAVLGIDAYDVTVEVDVAQGLPQWTIVGLPAGAVKESRERVGAALVNSGFVVPPRRITINLAPADIRKDGTAFDLPIALGILVATGQLARNASRRSSRVGELGLDGTLRAVRGALPVARHVSLGRSAHARACRRANVAEAALVRATALVAPASLRDLVAALRRNGSSRRHSRRLARRGARASRSTSPMWWGRTPRSARSRSPRRADTTVFMVGPPGAGKTMLARRLPSILPALTEDEALEVTAIHSVAGVLALGDPRVAARPFRAPHHTISAAGLVGGGNPPRPGEVSLAHHGVLFLDELLEFRRHVARIAAPAAGGRSRGDRAGGDCDRVSRRASRSSAR